MEGGRKGRMEVNKKRVRGKKEVKVPRREGERCNRKCLRGAEG